MCLCLLYFRKWPVPIFRRTRCSDQENEGALCIHLEMNSYLYGYALEACRIFSILWEGYTKEESSWVPETSLTAVAKR